MNNSPSLSGVPTNTDDDFPHMQISFPQSAPVAMSQSAMAQGPSTGPALILRSSIPAPPRSYLNPMQSIDAVLHQPARHHYAGSAHSIYHPRFLPEQSTARSVADIFNSGFNDHDDDNDDDNDDDDEDEFAAFDRLMEDYETACEHGDFRKLLSLPPPADPDDIWSEIEDVSVRNQQWGYLQQLMEKFDKQFDTDFMAEIVSSGYDDSHKACVIDLALKCGWNINSPKSDGGYVLCNALDNETNEVLGFLLHRGADPNLFLDDLELDTDDPINTPTGLPLQEAAQYGSLDQVHILLQGGASPHTSNAIHAAIRSDEDEVQKIKLLLDYHADKNALEWAGNSVMTSLLQQKGIRQVAAIALAYDLNKPHVVQFLLDTSIDPAALPSKGKTLPGIRRPREQRHQKKGHRMNASKAALIGKAGLASSPTGSSPGKSGARSPSHVSKTKRSVTTKRNVRMHGCGKANQM